MGVEATNEVVLGFIAIVIVTVLAAGMLARWAMQHGYSIEIVVDTRAGELRNRLRVVIRPPAGSP
jgi:archaellum component FlaG (FlaF/FlaG flagellin family)